MRKSLEVDLDVDTNTLSYELDGNETLAVEVGEQQATLYLNRGACMVLARILAKLAFADYEPGFHVHLKDDFDEERGLDSLTIVRQ